MSMADDATDKVTTGELVTYLNDALLFAPSMLLGPATTWTPVDGWTLVGDRRRFANARAVWHFASGDFCYAELTTATMEILFDTPPDPRAR